MTTTEEAWSYEPEALVARIDKYKDVVAGHVDYFSNQLIATARAREYDLRIRSGFLIAICAKSMLYDGSFLQSSLLVDRALEAIGSRHGLLAIEGEDPEMCQWAVPEWLAAIRGAASSALRSEDNTLALREESLEGYLELLEGLRDDSVYFLEVNNN